ncbi:MAG: maleylpyruvate isomerase family mycothiol-dependent enzyme, partial [Acidimicrobiales bacterium]
MHDIARQLAAVAAATSRLIDDAERLEDEEVAAPSLLPGWNRAQVLTHVARNADGLTGMILAAQRGEVGQQYPHGRSGRSGDIDAGRDRGSREVVADLREAARRLAGAAEGLGGDEWERLGETFAGVVTLRRMMIGRRREVEVHHSDLGLGYGPDDWPADFVAEELALVVAGLDRRIQPGSQLHLATVDGMGEWNIGASAAGDAKEGPSMKVAGPGAQMLAWLLGRPTTLSDLPPSERGSER